MTFEIWEKRIMRKHTHYTNYNIHSLDKGSQNRNNTLLKVAQFWSSPMLCFRVIYLRICRWYPSNRLQRNNGSSKSIFPFMSTVLVNPSVSIFLLCGFFVPPTQANCLWNDFLFFTLLEKKLPDQCMYKY